MSRDDFIIDDLKRDIIYYFKKQYDLGMLNSFEGNITVRIPDSENFLVTPTQQVKEKITPEMILEVDKNGNLVEESQWKPSSELGMHLKIYELRPDIQAVVHNHSTYATAFALVGRPISNEMAEGYMFYGGDIPVCPYGRPGTPAVYAHFEKYFVDKDKDVVLLANHGLVAAGKSVSQAFSKAEAVEKLAKIVIASEALGPDLPLSAVEKEKLLEVYKARKD